MKGNYGLSSDHKEELPIDDKSVFERSAAYELPDLTRFDLRSRAENAIRSALTAIVQARPEDARQVLHNRSYLLGQHTSVTFTSTDLALLLEEAALVPGISTVEARYIIFLASLGKTERDNPTYADQLVIGGRQPDDLPVLTSWQSRPTLRWNVGLNILAGPTSTGKTTHIINQIIELLRNPDLEGTILLWSGETPENDVRMKIQGILAGATRSEMIAAGRSQTIPAHIYAPHKIYDAFRNRIVILPSSATFPQVRRAAESLAKQEKLLAVFVDYLQHMRVDTSPERAQNREAEVGGISGDLLELGLSLRVPVIAGAQFNRTVNRSNEYIPHLNQLRDSGRIEQDAAVIIGMRNEDMSGAERPDLTTPTEIANEIWYLANNEEKLRMDRLGAMISVQIEHPEGGWILQEAFILKNRNDGGVGIVIPYAFHPSTGRLAPLEQRLVVRSNMSAKAVSSGFAAKENKKFKLKAVRDLQENGVTPILRQEDVLDDSWFDDDDE